MAQRDTTQKKYVYKTASSTLTMPDGSKKTVKTYGKTQREADAKLRIKITEIEQTTLYLRTKAPVMVFFRDWLEQRQAGRRAVQNSTYRDYKGRIENHLAPVLEGLALCEVKAAHCEAVMDRVKGGSQSDINKTWQLLSSGFNAAVANGLLAQSPLAGVTRPKGSRGKRRSLTDTEYNNLKDAINAVMAKATEPDSSVVGAVMAALSVGCGLRPGEVMALNWANVKLKDQPTLTVAGAVKKGERQVGTPKTDAGYRSLPLSAWLVEILTRYREISGGGGFAFLFPGVCNSLLPTSAGSRRTAWEQIRKAASLPPDVDMYALRHTYCTRGAKAGVDLRTMRYLMGHESVQITAEIYTDITDDMVQTASRAMEKLG